MTGSQSPIPLAVPDLRGREAEYLTRCVRDNWVSSAGPFVTEIEQRMMALSGRRRAVATVNGTAGLHLALLSVGVQPGDYVIVPDWTFAATANAVCHAGAVPFFVDISAESWTLDPALLAAAIDKPPGRIGAVIAVDTLGHPADMDPIQACCAKAGIPLIEDAAGAIGARYRGRAAGALGDISVFSFNGNKTITAGGGGMVLTDRDDWATQIRDLSTQARQGPAYSHSAVAFNYRMTNLNAAVAVAQMERLDEMLAAKRRIARSYDDALRSRSDLVPMPRRDWAESGCWLYSVLCSSPRMAEDLVQHLAKFRIEARVFWQSLSRQAHFSTSPRLLADVSTGISGRVVSLPCSSNLDVAVQRLVISAIEEFPRHNQ